MSDTSMRRQIVICCDGTNNTLTGGSNDTNVVLLHNYLAAQPTPAGEVRVLYYDPGVGSPGTLPPVGPVDWAIRKWERVSGLASGGGVFDNVAEAYLFLMRQWRGHEDRIFLFGFSRGAFTVRALAGMINLFGILKPEYEALVPTLVHLYFTPSDKSRGGPMQKLTRWLFDKTSREDSAAAEPAGHAQLDPADDRAGQQPGRQPRKKAAKSTDDRERMAQEVRANFAGEGREDAWVHWVGVWDTVESVGLPGPFSRVNPSPPVVLGKRYRHVRHALSLDEHRWPFVPRLYEEPGDIDNGEQTLKQRWYPGVHCDAGGSYKVDQCGISDAALRWMVEEAALQLGIAPMVQDTTQPVQMWRHDPLWDTPFWALGGMTVRPMAPKLKLPGRAPADFIAIPADNLPDQPIHSVWEKRRKLWPAIAALLLGFATLVASGLCLLGTTEVKLLDPMTMVRAIQATQDHADQQLAALWFEGVMEPGYRPWESDAAVQPGWAAFWDLVFVGCWGYLLARVSSRAFAWLVGDRTVGSKRPVWWPLGFAPMLAVCAVVAGDLSTWFALALHGAGTDTLAKLALFLGGVAALLKFVGFAACATLLAVRWRIGFNPGLLWPHSLSQASKGARPTPHRQHLGDAIAAVALAAVAMAVWAFSRGMICWGQYNWYGVGGCNSHLVAIALVALAALPIVRVVRQLARPVEVSAAGLRTMGVRPASEGLRSLGGAGLLGAALATLLILASAGLLGWLMLGTGADIRF